jgi:Bifunctional DNA primase/polymerase, N-terminal
MSNLEYALMYLNAGASVVPVGTDKKPLLPWKCYQTRAASTAEVVGWFRRWPHAGLAIVCGAVSDLCVLDVEHEAIPELLDLTVPDTPTVRTQGNGLHFYFKYDRALRSTTWARFGRHCGELRSDGNYVLVPPSYGPLGQYSWLRSPTAVEPAQAPSWMYELSQRAAQPAAVRGRTVPDGPSRSEDDQRVALAMLLDGASEGETYMMLASRPAAQDRSNAADYCDRTVRRAAVFARQHYHRVRIVHVVLQRRRAFISFVVLAGAHRDRVLRRPFVMDDDASEESAFGSLLRQLRRPLRRSSDLIGLELRSGIFETSRGLRMSHRLHPLACCEEEGEP